MKKKVIDIYPPSSKQEEIWEEAKLEEVAAPQNGFSLDFGLGKFAVAGLLLALGIPLLSLHFYFAKAKVEVWPQITELHIEESVTAQTGAESVILAKKIIRAETFTQEKVVSNVFPATGTKEAESRAEGTIRVHNTNTSSQTLVANTRFISEGGQLFRSQERVVVPAGSSAEVQVLAAEPGGDYNIGPSNFSLPGLVGSPLYTRIYGESSSAMNGGAAAEAAVVTQEDIASAREQLVEEGTRQSREALQAQVPEGFQILEDSIGASVLEDDSLVKEGAELERFNYRVTVEVSALAYHTGDLDTLARHLVQQELEEEEAINEETLQISGQVNSARINGGTVPITLNIQVDRYNAVDARLFAQEISGRSAENFREVMGDHPYLARAEFSLWPFWIQKVPQDPQRIKLNIMLEEPEN